MNKHPDNNLLEAYASGNIDAVSWSGGCHALRDLPEMPSVCK